jgi:UDP-3-O-acyl-N-acetylglucosamine deacetylase
VCGVRIGDEAERHRALDLRGDLLRIGDNVALAESGFAADGLDLGFQS